MIDEAAKNLLPVKAECKAVTGSDWKPKVVPAAAAVVALPARGSAQGDLQRKLKFEMPEEPEIDEVVNRLSPLKDGQGAFQESDWNPVVASASENLQERYLHNSLLPQQILTPSPMPQSFLHQELVSSLHLPMGVMLYHPNYGYSFTPVFIDNSFICMEDNTALQQSHAFQIHGQHQD